MTEHTWTGDEFLRDCIRASILIRRAALTSRRVRRRSALRAASKYRGLR